MKVAVIGANGQLGSDICEFFSKNNTEIYALTHNDIEITDVENVKNVLSNIRPDVIINTSAYHNVPKCEENPTLSFKVNCEGPLNLAKISNELNCKLVYYSTDYVFDGLKRQPYIESDAPNPLNIYALTKLSGEYVTRNYSEKHFVIRISGIYGKVVCRAKGNNFVTTMLKAAKEKDVVKVVNDEILTPTPTEEIAKNTFALIQTNAYGLYHMTSQGECSWYEFAKVIFEKLNLKTPLEQCSSKDFPQTVKRPSYSVLDNYNLKKINLDQMSFWKDALINFLEKYYS